MVFLFGDIGGLLSWLRFAWERQVIALVLKRYPIINGAKSIFDLAHKFSIKG